MFYNTINLKQPCECIVLWCHIYYYFMWFEKELWCVLSEIKNLVYTGDKCELNYWCKLHIFVIYYWYIQLMFYNALLVYKQPTGSSHCTSCLCDSLQLLGSLQMPPQIFSTFQERNKTSFYFHHWYGSKTLGSGC